MAAVTSTAQKDENPTKALDQQQPQQPRSDPPSKNNGNASSTPLSAAVAESSLNDVDELKVSAAGAEVSLTAVKDGNNDQADEPVSDIQKKIRRAERFGMPVQLSEEDKRNSRAERFGIGPAVHGSGALKKSEEQKRKARAERFGISQSVPANEEAKKKARVARFGTVPKTDQLEEDKKKARAIRFSQPQSGSLSQVNGKGNDSEIKTAIAGKAGGET